MAVGFIQLKRDACAGVLQHLRGADYRVLFALIAYSDKHGVCYPGLERLSNDTGLGLGSVRRSLLELERHGLLDRKGPTSKERFMLTDMLMVKPGRKATGAEITGDRSVDGQAGQVDGQAGSLVIPKLITGDPIRTSSEGEEPVPVVLKRENKKRQYSGRKRSRREVEVDHSVVDVASSSRNLRESTEREAMEHDTSISISSTSESRSVVPISSTVEDTSPSSTSSPLSSFQYQPQEHNHPSSLSSTSPSPKGKESISGSSSPSSSKPSDRLTTASETTSASTGSILPSSTQHESFSPVSSQTRLNPTPSALPVTSSIPSAATSTPTSETRQPVPTASNKKSTTADEDWSIFLPTPRSNLKRSLIEHIVRVFEKLPQYNETNSSRESCLARERQFIKNLIEPSLDVTTLSPESFAPLLYNLRELDHDAILRGEARKLLTPFCPGDNVFAVRDAGYISAVWK